MSFDKNEKWFDINQYYGDDDIAKDVLKSKYLAPWEESPGEMWERLATGAASIEEPGKRNEMARLFHGILADFKFIPGGRINYGLGRTDINVSTSNCYVIGNREDSLNGIYQFLTEQGLTYAATGGVGTDISVLRPRGTPISRGGSSPGAVSFMDLYSINTNTIAQNGRRGACMITISVDHPDVEEFITIKSDNNRSKVQFANISIRLTDEFLRAVQDNSLFDLRWNNKVYKTVNARDLWFKIVKHARDSAEPGLLFWDRMKEYHNLEHFPGHEIISTNPCAEQSLGDSASCNLGHMNILKYCFESSEPQTTYVDGSLVYNFNWDAFKRDCAIAVRFMDNVLDWNEGRHATEKQNEVCKQERRVGIGITGLADAMICLGIKYDTPEGVAFAGNILKAQCIALYEASVELAKERGAFPIYDKDLYFKSKFIQELPEDLKEKISRYGIRNSLLNTIAPVGTGSIIAQCSSGVEPIFAFSYLRNVKDHTTTDGKKQYKVYHPLIKRLFGTDDNLPSYVISSHEIDWENRVKLQGACQRWVDSAISSTINLPRDVTTEIVAKIYFTAWSQGLKGVTVYREGSREGVLITESQEETTDEKLSEHGNIIAVNLPKRPKKLTSETHKIKVDAGNGEIRNAYITISFSETSQKPYEIFINAPIKEDKDRQIMDLAARTTSMMLRHRIPINFIVEQLEKVDNQFLYSIPTNIARVLRQYDADEITAERPESIPSEKLQIAEKAINEMIHASGLDKCPECKERSMHFENGCKVCSNCGFSGCG